MVSTSSPDSTAGSRGADVVRVRLGVFRAGHQFASTNARWPRCTREAGEDSDDVDDNPR